MYVCVRGGMNVCVGQMYVPPYPTKTNSLDFPQKIFDPKNIFWPKNMFWPQFFLYPNGDVMKSLFVAFFFTFFFWVQ